MSLDTDKGTLNARERIGDSGTDVTGRRRFLSQLSLAATGSALAMARPASCEIRHALPTALGAAHDAPPLPTIPLGEHRISRLIVGSNTISGYSYMGPIMDRHMREYFTPEQTLEFLWDCERAGIDTHQFSDPVGMAGVFRKLRDRGSEMKFICLLSGQPHHMRIEQVVRDTRPIAIAHHGGVTDRLFREGKSGEVRDFVNHVHDAGVLAGVSAHNPDCIKRIADEGWPVDFFMACFYHLTRTREELEKMRVVTLQIGYSFFASDPVAMTDVIRQVDQPCLAYKILASGRNCGNKQAVEGAFRFAFERIKPTDGVIVGMYPRFHDQMSENAAFTRQFGQVRST